MASGQELRARREAVIQRHVDAENNHDIAGAVASFAQPRYDVPALGPAGQAPDAQAVQDLLGTVFAGFPDFHVALGPLHHADGAVFVEVQMTGTHQGMFAGMSPTGRQMDVRVGCLFEFDADHLVCERVYFDFATVLRQLGAMPAPEQQSP